MNTYQSSEHSVIRDSFICILVALTLIGMIRYLKAVRAPQHKTKWQMRHKPSP